MQKWIVRNYFNTPTVILTKEDGEIIGANFPAEYRAQLETIANVYNSLVDKNQNNINGRS